MTLKTTMERGWHGLRRGAAALGALALRLAGAVAALAFMAVALGLGLVLAGAVLLWGLLRARRPGSPAASPGADARRAGPAASWRVRRRSTPDEVVDVEARELSPSGPRGA